MDPGEFDRVAAAFAAFHREFAPLFGRKEVQRRSEQYMRGLLVQQTDRRNAENVAEAVEGATPRALQRLLTEAPWETAPVVAALQRYLAPRLNAPDGVFVIDESGIPKKGTKSVGVARQYCGALGKVGNCQLGVFLAYVSERGHALMDARLYLPREWADDRPLPCRRGARGGWLPKQGGSRAGAAGKRADGRPPDGAMGHCGRGLWESPDVAGRPGGGRLALRPGGPAPHAGVPAPGPGRRPGLVGEGAAADAAARGRRDARDARAGMGRWLAGGGLAGGDRGRGSAGAPDLPVRGAAGLGEPRRPARTGVLAGGAAEPGRERVEGLPLQRTRGHAPAHVGAGRRGTLADRDRVAV